MTSKHTLAPLQTSSLGVAILCRQFSSKNKKNKESTRKRQLQQETMKIPFHKSRKRLTKGEKVNPVGLAILAGKGHKEAAKIKALEKAKEPKEKREDHRDKGWEFHLSIFAGCAFFSAWVGVLYTETNEAPTLLGRWSKTEVLFLSDEKDKFTNIIGLIQSACGSNYTMKTQLREVIYVRRLFQALKEDKFVNETCQPLPFECESDSRESASSVLDLMCSVEDNKAWYPPHTPPPPPAPVHSLVPSSMLII